MLILLAVVHRNLKGHAAIAIALAVVILRCQLETGKVIKSGLSSFDLARFPKMVKRQENFLLLKLFNLNGIIVIAEVLDPIAIPPNPIALHAILEKRDQKVLLLNQSGYPRILEDLV
jgi:hypothetical protein